jgi:hypothetical protein
MRGWLAGGWGYPLAMALLLLACLSALFSLSAEAERPRTDVGALRSSVISCEPPRDSRPEAYRRSCQRFGLMPQLVESPVAARTVH